MEGITRPRGPLRPTLIIAMDAFGIRVQELLLTDLAKRGLLEPVIPANSTLGERYLYNLALLRLGDPPSGNTGDYEIMRDILDQVRCLSLLPHDDLPERFSSELERAKRRLHDQSTRQKYRDFSPPGLDIIVLAHPTSVEEVGRLSQLLKQALFVLMQAGGAKAIDSAQAIRTVVILDFDNFENCRKDLKHAIEINLKNWQDWRSRGPRVVGRVYLLNGQSSGLQKDARLREAETSTFIELMLYEGTSDETIRLAFHPARSAEGILATFGVQVLERGAGLAVQYAAAYYAYHWLGYLLSDAPEREPEIRHTREFLRHFDTAGPNSLTNQGEFEDLSNRAIDEFRESLTHKPLEDENQWDSVISGFESIYSRLREKLDRRVGEKRALLRRQELAEFGRKLRGVISKDLDSDRQPLPLGAVLQELDVVMDRFEEKTTDASPPDMGSLFANLRHRMNRLREALSRQRRTQIDEGRFRVWWWVYALVLALAVAPVMQELVGQIDTNQLLLSLKPYYPLDVLASAMTSIDWEKP
uniref:Uncharacterized protein n=1 Tax=Candidatus Kentrum sp. UNK TaxID=2126344 RepID=A0A450ZWH6_9GAMM|nr:MAG: hypothetical protein BECKUNK1418G_GA0071005_100212 [Candidatus Kentron sp. UNK]VFK68251.1 MAG: hypothetical protein BECKUNK1418H_GA0071006_100112 [Candidatus Kentron sp. UNK]